MKPHQPDLPPHASDDGNDRNSAATGKKKSRGSGRSDKAPHPTPGPRLLTRADVAYLLRISKRTVDRMVKDGLLPAVRIGRGVRFKPQALKKILDKQ